MYGLPAITKTKELVVSNPSWSSGARSIEPLVGDGWFSFGVPVGSAGVFVGLVGQDQSTQPSECPLGIMFGSGRYRVQEFGTDRTYGATYSEGQSFAIARYADTIYCCVGNTPVSVNGVPFSLPGTVFYAYSVDSGTAAVGGAGRTDMRGGLYLDASLLMGGDQVVNASMTKIDGIATMMMRPLEAVAFDAEDEQGTASIALEVMTADANNGVGVNAMMPPLVAVSFEGEDQGVASIALEPMTVTAVYGRSSLVGASISFEYLAASGDGPAHNRVVAWTEFLGVSASEIDHAEASIAMQPPFVLAYAGSQNGLLRFVGVLPGLLGNAYPEPDVIDTAIALDRIYPASYTVITSTAIAGDETAAGAGILELVEDGALASTEALISTSVLLADGAIAGDGVVAASTAMLTTDVARASSEVLASAVSNHLLEDGAKAGDSAMPYVFNDVTATAVAQDLPLIASDALVVDGALAGDELVADSVRAFALLEDVAVAGDALLVQAVSSAILQDAAIASERVFMKTPGLVAWVMNADTGAAAWYDNWPFASIATVGGKVFATGPDGLHLLGGNTDGADAIDARVQYGFSEFGGYDQSGHPKPSEQKKRVAALWYGYTADGPMQATVETYGQGLPVFEYAMTERSAQQPRSNRVVVGKGLNSRYWRIGIKNDMGSAFEVHSLSAEVMQSSRRI